MTVGVVKRNGRVINGSSTRSRYREKFDYIAFGFTWDNTESGAPSGGTSAKLKVYSRLDDNSPWMTVNIDGQAEDGTDGFASISLDTETGSHMINHNVATPKSATLVAGQYKIEITDDYTDVIDYNLDIFYSKRSVTPTAPLEISGGGGK